MSVSSKRREMESIERRFEELWADNEAMKRQIEAEAEISWSRKITIDELVASLRFIADGISVSGTPEDTAFKFRSAARAALSKAGEQS